MDECKIILMGFGAVGKGVAKAISLKKGMIDEKYGITLKVVAAADSSTSAICQDGLDEELLLKTKEESGKLANYPEYGSDKSGIEVLDAVDYDVLIEATPTNIKDAEPAKSLTLKAFADGKDVVTSNKGHLALFYKELIEAKGITRYRLAKLADTRFEVVEKWCSGSVERIDSDVLARFCFILNCDISDIIKYE